MKQLNSQNGHSSVTMPVPVLQGARTAALPINLKILAAHSAKNASAHQNLAAHEHTKKPEITALGRRINTTTLSVSNLHKYGELYSDLLRMRKTVFIDKRGWSLPEADGLEFDQYDTPQSRWVAIHSYGEILAGVRLTPTTARCGIYSYMIRDAQRGMLESIPSDLLFVDAPVNPGVWEASRIFIADGVEARQRLSLQSILLSKMASEAQKLGAKFVLGIVPAVWPRWLRRIGMHALAIGPVNDIEGERCQAALVRTPRYVS